MYAYARERLLASGAIAATLVVTGAAQAIRGWRGPLSALADLTIASLLVAQFRLWDDLADRGRDAQAHPARVLVRAPSTAPFIATLVSLASIDAMLVVGRWGVGGSIAMVAILIAGVAGWYATRGPRSAIGDHVLLGKYPLFVIVIAGGPRAVASIGGGLVLVGVYLAVCVYEAWHDPASPFGPVTRAVEALLLVTIAAAFVLSLEATGGTP